MTQFRYARAKFHTSVAVAIGLTAIITFLVWLFCRLLGLANANLITALAGLIFFGFCSAAMIWRYYKGDVVLAVRPDGLFDARYSSEAVPWEHIKDIRLGRMENDFQLGVFLWPDRTRHGNGAEEPEFVIDLEPLDAGVDAVLEALSTRANVSLARG